jgi:hypothetical protein
MKAFYLGFAFIIAFALSVSYLVVSANEGPRYVFVMVSSADSLVIQKLDANGVAKTYPLPAGSLIGFIEGKVPIDFIPPVSASNRMIY